MNKEFIKMGIFINMLSLPIFFFIVVGSHGRIGLYESKDSFFLFGVSLLISIIGFFFIKQGIHFDKPLPILLKLVVTFLMNIPAYLLIIVVAYSINEYFAKKSNIKTNDIWFIIILIVAWLISEVAYLIKKRNQKESRLLK